MFLKYIVFFIFCFNISALSAAEITYDFDEKIFNDELPVVSGRLDLPHAARLRELLADDGNSPIGRIIILGKYFDEKYPGDLINTDFSADVADIFPELSQQEVYERTNTVRHVVHIYRAGMTKYNEIKESFLVPEEPPLLFDENDYDHPEQYSYIPVPEGQVAVVYDFKKVLSYGNNPRDKKAMEAYRQRQVDNKVNKTAFDKFKSMVEKLEFSKLPFYGISLPNPFVGNAGIGHWQDKEGFKVRLISDVATISNQQDFLAAIHVNVPNHRFMLATALSDTRLKPEIKIIESKNVKDYQVFYPLPVKFAHEDVVGAYAGDFAFPLKITTIDPNEDVWLKAEIGFQSCDQNLNCEYMKFFPELLIEKSPEKAMSGMMNFVKQSYYNLPKKQNKNLSLEQIDVTLSDDGKKLEKVQFVFEFSGSINNFSLFLEDELHSRFKTPKISVHDSKIYATVVPETNQDLLLNQEADLTLRLNAYTSLRQKIKLADFNNATLIAQKTALYFALLGLIVGILFNFMPAALPFWLLPLNDFLQKKVASSYFSTIIISIFAGCNLYAGALIAINQLKHPVIWGTQYQNFFWLMAVILLLLSILIYQSHPQNWLKNNLKFKGAAVGIALTFLMPFSFTPLLAKNFFYLQENNCFYTLCFFNAAAIGISCLYFIMAKLPKFKMSQKASRYLQNFSFLISVLMLVGMIVWLLLLFFLQMSLINFFKLLFWLLVAAFVYNYFFAFLRALSQTKLPKKQKIITKNIVAGIYATLSVLLIWLAVYNKKITLPAYHLPENLEERLLQGKIVLIGLIADWSLLSHYNDLTVLNTNNLERWKQKYQFEYIPVNVQTNLYESSKFLRDHNTAYLPLYVLYSYNFENGLILSPLLISSHLEQVIEDAEF